MSRIYRVKRVAPGEVNWDDVPAASIDSMPWRGMEAPSAQGQVAFDGQALRVRLKAWEPVEHIAEHNPNGGVWMDNCCEFFLNASGRNMGAYLNFEINGAGVPHVGFGVGRDRRVLDAATFGQFNFKAAKTDTAWQVTFDVPVKLLNELYPRLTFEPGKAMMGNFQKCCVYGGRDHAASWNPIPEEVFDFHRPEYFGVFILD